MILIGITIIVLGLFLLPLAWRGRISARGQFCRKCKFDLAGLPMESTRDKCPECGQAIHTQTSRRTTLRRSSRVGLVTAVVLMLAGLTGTGIGLTGNSAAIYAAMPDGIIVRLSTLGSDGALDELVVRLTRTPPLSDAYWDTLIDHALKVQADPLAPWDPTLGEVLADAWITDRLSEEQIKQYLQHAVNIEILIRDKIRQGSSKIPCKIEATSGRIHAVNSTQTGYSLEIKVLGTTIASEPERKYGPLGTPLRIGTFGVNVPAQGSSWSSGSAFGIQPISALVNAEPGTEIDVTVNCQFLLTGNAIEEPEPFKTISFTQPVRVIAPDESLVGLINDPDHASMLCKRLQVSQIRVLEELNTDRQGWTPILGFSTMVTDGYPDPVSFRVFLRIDDQEVEIGYHIHEQSFGGSFGSSVSWSVDPEKIEESEHATKILSRLKELGKADVILRTDPTIAESDTSINEILNASLIYYDVPIEPVGTYQLIWNSSRKTEWVSPDCD